MSAAYDIFADDFEQDAVDAERVQWPSPAWRGRYLEFARDVLGKRVIAQHQVKLLNEYYKPQVILAVLIFIVVCTGQKLGKTETMIIAAAFDFATERDLNGFVFGPKLEHTNEVFWPRFVKDMLAAYYPCSECMPSHRAWVSLADANPLDETKRPERCPKCSPLIPSRLKNPKEPREGRVSDWLDEKRSENGLRAPDGRMIRGYVSRKEGGKGGFSGVVRFYLDEASDISETDKATVDGNLSGGGKAFAFGNMLYSHGWFYRAFKNEQHHYSFVFQLSSRYSPNCPGTIKWSDGVVTANDNAGRPVPGMATPEAIERNLTLWKGTNYITARIDAKPPEIVEGQLSGAEVVRDAEQRWKPTDEGLLQLGVDVARIRDKLAIAVRRGKTIVETFAECLNQPDHTRGVELVIEYGKRYRKPNERKPRLVFDASGLEGDAFAKELRAQNADEYFDIYPVQMGAPPRNRKIYFKRRDEIAHNFATWLRNGGAIPTDMELEAEIDATTSKAVKFTWAGNTWEVQQVITNDELRPIIGRSPDIRNACELAVLDVDGSEAHNEPEPAPKPITEAQVLPVKQAPVKRQPEPANDVDQDDTPANIYERQAMVYQEMWGHS